MAINSLHELYSTKFWNVYPLLFNGYRDILLSNIEFRTPFIADKKENSLDNEKNNVLIIQKYTSSTEISSIIGKGVAVNPKKSGRIYIGNAVNISRWYGDEITEEDVIVNKVNVVGPVLRNGDICAYGSMDQRDQIMRASEISNVAGHLIYLNTPGGSSASLQDFQLAFDYARSKKQSIIGLVDGMCASMGTGIASQCDEIYFVNPKDEIGCIGTYAAFITSKDGDVNATTQERYCEIYASDSIEKNKWYRDAAEGDYKLIQEEINTANNNFKAAIKAGRPSITDDQMTGKMYPCGEVIGTLVDGQSTLGEVAAMIVERMPKKDDKNTASSKGASSGEPHSAHPAGTSAQTQSQSSNQNKDNMKNYQKIASALGLEELGADKENAVYLQEELAVKLESSLTEKEAETEGLNQQLETANATIETQKQTIESLQAAQGSNEADVTTATQRADKAETDLQASQQEIETLKSSLQEKETALNAATETVATQKQEIDELKATNETLSKNNEILEVAATASAETIAQLSREKEALQDEIKGLQAGPGVEDSAGEQPKNNNTITPKVGIANGSVYDENLSPAENRKRIEERDKQLKESRNR